MYKKMLLAALLALTFCVTGIARNDDYYREHTKKLTFKCDGIEREYYLYVPDNLPENAPLFVFLTGHSRKVRKECGYYEYMYLADEHKFVVLSPVSLPESTGRYSWNVGYCFQKEHGFEVDDVKFLTKLVRHVQKEYKLDKNKAFVTGTSNGGEMCYHLAYTAPDLFRAYAPQYGLTMTWLYKTVTPKKAVPLFEIHGTEDHTSEWEGDPTNKGGWGEYISVPLAVSVWANKAHCTHEIREEVPTKDPSSERKVISHKFVGGDDGIEVWLYEIVGAHHGDFGREIQMNDLVWSFFEKYL